MNGIQIKNRGDISSWLCFINNIDPHNQTKVLCFLNKQYKHCQTPDLVLQHVRLLLHSSFRIFLEKLVVPIRFIESIEPSWSFYKDITCTLLYFVQKLPYSHQSNQIVLSSS